MQISEVRVKLIPNPTDRLKAFCSITLDGDFVIRDIKLIEGGTGIFVAMPSRKLSDHCPKCHAKNHLRARYCNECAASLGDDRVRRDKAGRRKLHADIAHPINSECRQGLQERIVEAFSQETVASQQPGYKPTQLDDEEDFVAADADLGTQEPRDSGRSNTEDEDNRPGRDRDHTRFADSFEDEVDSKDEVDFEDDVDSEDEPDSDEASDCGGGYQEMIAELKRDAAERRSGQSFARFDNRVEEIEDTVPANDTHTTDDADDIDDDDGGFGAGIDDAKPDRRERMEPAVVESPAVMEPPAVIAAPESNADDFGSGIL